jgi:hypothetical protein
MPSWSSVARAACFRAFLGRFVFVGLLELASASSPQVVRAGASTTAAAATTFKWVEKQRNFVYVKYHSVTEYGQKQSIDRKAMVMCDQEFRPCRRLPIGTIFIVED